MININYLQLVEQLQQDLGMSQSKIKYKPLFTETINELNTKDNTIKDCFLALNWILSNTTNHKK